MTKNKKRSSLRSSVTRVQDPIAMELTEVARESFTHPNGNGEQHGLRVQLHDESSEMFPYGSAGDDDGDCDDIQKIGREGISLNEENMIDILANVDSEIIDGEHMVTHKEDSLSKTIAGVAGNVLEWYDFAVFGFFSDILGDVFFPPHQDGHAAIIESFAVFGGAFFMRPVGGVLMGYIGDKYGSRKALTLSIFLMAFPTFAMGCLPGYATVGEASIVLLTIVRLLQGLSVGGQLMSSLIFTLERHPKSKWGLYGSYVMAAANAGTLLGGLVATIIRNTLSDEALHSWGWRIPFLSGILVSVSGFYLKNQGEDDDESGHIHGAPSNSAANPIRLAFSRSNIRSLLASCTVPMLWSVGFYLTFVWMTVYMTDLIESPVPNSFGVNSLSLSLSACLLFPLCGWISDKIGRKRTMAVGGLAMAVGSPLMITLIGTGQVASAFCAQMFLGISLSLWGAPMMAWLAETFEPGARLTSVSIGYNVAQACGGGMAPAIATVMVDRLGTETPGYYMAVVAIISLVGLLCIAPRSSVHFTAVQGEDDLEQTDNEDDDRELI